jgi:hypothetical protein
MDVPGVALEMMQIFVSGQSFDMSKQSLESSPEATSPSCPTCETCPTCEDCSTDNDQSPPTPSDCGCVPCPANDSETQSNIPSGSSTDTSSAPSRQTGIVAGVIAVAFALGGVVTFVVMGKRSPPTRSIVPQYDLELRQRNTYTDLPESGFA